MLPGSSPRDIIRKTRLLLSCRSPKRRRKLKNIPKYNIALTGSPNSCLLQVGKNKYRSLLDSGAEVSIMHRRVYRALKQKPALIKKVARLQSINGGLLKIDGFVTLSCKIGNTECTHGFYVSPSIN